MSDYICPECGAKGTQLVNDSTVLISCSHLFGCRFNVLSAIYSGVSGEIVRGSSPKEFDPRKDTDLEVEALRPGSRRRTAR